VSNQLQQWTNFCTNFSPKKWGDAVDQRPRPTTPLVTARHSSHASLGDDHVDDETVSDDAEDRDDAVQDRHGDLVQMQTDPRDDVVL